MKPSAKDLRRRLKNWEARSEKLGLWEKFSPLAAPIENLINEGRLLEASDAMNGFSSATWESTISLTIAGQKQREGATAGGREKARVLNPARQERDAIILGWANEYKNQKSRKVSKSEIARWITSKQIKPEIKKRIEAGEDCVRVSQIWDISTGTVRRIIAG